MQELGAKVRVLARPNTHGTRLHRDKIEVIYGDLRDKVAMVGLCKDAELVFHLGATQEFGMRDSEFLDINVGGTERLIQLAMQDGVRRFILVSSGGVHHNDSGEPVDEESPVRSSNIYFESKIQAEAIAKELYRNDPGCLTIVRPSFVYGPGDHRRLKLYRAVIRGYFMMIGSGTRYIHPVYCEDLIEGLLLAGTDSGRGETFLLGGPEVLSLQEFTDVIARAAGVPPPRWKIPVGPVRLAATLCEFLSRHFGGAPPLNQRRMGFFLNHRNYDLSKARALLGYNPRISVEDGVRRTLAWYKREGWL
jgi:nucleoside-diphosphate-sugar epimerase